MLGDAPPEQIQEMAWRRISSQRLDGGQTQARRGAIETHKGPALAREGAQQAPLVVTPDARLEIAPVAEDSRKLAALWIQQRALSKP
jgi:hypothetical protein